MMGPAMNHSKITMRGFVMIGLFALTFFLFCLMAFDPVLLKDEFFKALAEAVIITGLINGVVGYLFSGSHPENPPKKETTL